MISLPTRIDHLRGYFGRLGLATKLALGFGAVLALSLLSGALVFFSYRDSVALLERYFDTDDVVGTLSDDSRIAMLTARRYEKEFLLKVDDFGFEEARSRYLTLFRAQLAIVRDDVARMRTITHSPDAEASVRAVETATIFYASSFAHVVDLYGRRGRADSGLEGQFRREAHLAESMLAEAPPFAMVELLNARRAEKDFITRGQQRYALLVNEHLDALRRIVTGLSMTAPRKSALLAAIADYRAGFAAYVAITADIEQAKSDYMDAVNRIAPELEKLRRDAAESAKATRNEVRARSRAIATLMLASGVAAILLGITVARFIVRHAQRGVGQSVVFAQRLAAGDWSARLTAVAGRNEFTSLAGALNRMADELQGQHMREESRNRELARANRTLHMLSHCNEALLGAASEEELLDVICERIVVDGGYPFTWVGLVGSAPDNLALAAQGGAPAPQMRPAVDCATLTTLRTLAGQPCHSGEDCGYRVRVVLTLRNRDEDFGFICIYSDDAEAFDVAEVALLKELADDLSFGIATQRDQQRRATAERELAYHVHHDAVTGLANRALFGDRLCQCVVHASRSRHNVAVLVFSLDRFRHVHNTLGDEAGNALLRHVSTTVGGGLREGDTFARFHGDDFSIVLNDLETLDDVRSVASKLLATVQEPFRFEGAEITTTASMGIALFPKDGTDPGELLLAANAALSSAQAMGGNRFRFYARDMNERARELFAMETDLRRAIDNGELRLYYQPRALLSDGSIAGAEALVRWQHPVLGLVPPSEFIPLAEQSGLVLPLGDWVLNESCRQQRAWADAGLPFVPLAVNVSPRQFRDPALVQRVQQALRTHGVAPHAIELEITESTVMDNAEDALATLRALKDAGLMLSLDDFGTGHSSLGRLRDLPVDHLKIDQSFVRHLSNDPVNAAICRSMIDLAHNLGLAVIAEGVETAGHLHFLHKHDCDQIQGYYFARPLPAAEFSAMLARGARLDLPSPLIDASRTLLLVDDEANVLAALQRMLRHEGYRILTANGGAQALELLATNEVQVIVSDQRMPGMCGADFLARARDLYPATVRMMLSGYTDLQSVTESVNKGAISKFVTKPWDDATLRADIREAFRRAERRLRVVA